MQLHNNQLNGSLPLTVNGWEALEELNLHNNQITGCMKDKSFGAPLRELISIVAAQNEQHLALERKKRLALAKILRPGASETAHFSTLEQRKRVQIRLRESPI